MEIRGHSWETNLPARRLVYTRDLYLPVQELAARIAATARNVLESTPPELAADIVDRGIVLAGGGALLRGMDALIEQRTGVNTLTVQNAMHVVAVGTGKYAERMSRMEF